LSFLFSDLRNTFFRQRNAFFRSRKAFFSPRNTFFSSVGAVLLTFGAFFRPFGAHLRAFGAFLCVFGAFLHMILDNLFCYFSVVPVVPDIGTLYFKNLANWAVPRVAHAQQSYGDNFIFSRPFAPPVLNNFHKIDFGSDSILGMVSVIGISKYITFTTGLVEL